MYAGIIVLLLAYVIHISQQSLYKAVDVTSWPDFSQPINVVKVSKSNAEIIHNGQSGHGPETVIVGGKLGSYMLCENGDVKLSVSISEAPTTVARVGGRPLGGAISQKESTKTHDVLYLAEASKGLLRVTIPLKSPSFHSATIELVSFELPDGTPILYADDVAVGAVTGDVYFSDASDVIVGRVKGSRTKFDTLASSIIDGIRGERTGKLLKYSPDTRLTTVVADKIWFANGVTLSPDEKYALICETFAARVLKVDLTPSLYGKVSVFASGVFPGYVDGLSMSSTGMVHVAVPSPSPPAILFLSKLNPIWLNTMARSLILLLPPFIKPVKYGCFVTLDLDGNVITTWLDEEGDIANFVTAVEEKDGKAYLGSLKEDKVVVVNLESNRRQ